MSYLGNRDQIHGHISYSQHGDDMIIANIFHLLHFNHPSYLDIGAHHPFNISNTALLYSKGSRGVNVDPSRVAYNLFCNHRPNDKNICVGVGPVAGTFPFYMYEDGHGRNTFSLAEVQTTPNEKINAIEHLPVATLSQIVAMCPNSEFPDLLNMDIEGYDFDVLSTADFSHSMPKVICVEVRKHDTLKFKSMMADQGYTLYVRCSENLIFIRNNLYESLF